MNDNELESTPVPTGQAGAARSAPPVQEDRPRDGGSSGARAAERVGDQRGDLVRVGCEAAALVGDPATGARAPRSGEGEDRLQGSLFGGTNRDLALEVLVPDGTTEGARAPTKDWVSQAISSAFADKDARRGPHYSHYISKLEAISLAAEAIRRGDSYMDDVADEFCDEEYLYDAPRQEVRGLIFTEFTWMRDFFYGP